MLNRQGRPTQPQAHGASDPAAGMAGEAARLQGDQNRLERGGRGEHPTFTGNRALAQIEPLIFEVGQAETTGVDLDEPEDFSPRLGGLERREPVR